MPPEFTAHDVQIPSSIAQSEDVYDERTVDEAKALVRDAADRDALQTADLQHVYAYEHSHKGRVTLLDWLASRIEDRGGDVPALGDPAGVAPESDPDARERAIEAGADADTLPVADSGDGGPAYTADGIGDETTLVTVRAPSTGYYNGVWFDAPGDKNVEWGPRVHDAVRDGRLGLVTARDESIIPEDLRPTRDRR